MDRKIVFAALVGVAGGFLAYGFESVPIQVLGTALLGVGVLLCRDKEVRNEAR